MDLRSVMPPKTEQSDTECIRYKDKIKASTHMLAVLSCIINIFPLFHGSYGEDALLPDRGTPPFSVTKTGSSSLTPKPFGFPIL